MTSLYWEIIRLYTYMMGVFKAPEARSCLFYYGPRYNFHEALSRVD
jgi:hypothetical protein